MTKYVINRILRSLFSVVLVVGIVMVMVYSCLDRNLIFAMDANYTKIKSNAKQAYMNQQWEKFGYVDYVPYSEYLMGLVRSGEITKETYDAVVKFANKAEQDSEEVAAFVQKFTEEYESKGYKVVRLDGDLKGLITTTTEKPAPNPVNPPKHDPAPAEPHSLADALRAKYTPKG